MIGGYVLDVTTMDVTNRYIATGTICSELVYFVEDDDGSGVVLEGGRGPSGIKGLKADSGDEGSVGN